MADYSEQEWREYFQPGAMEFETGNAEHELFLNALNEKLVWTEWWDFDADSAYLMNGFEPFSGAVSGIQGWYVCATPWEGESRDHYVNMESDL